MRSTDEIIIIARSARALAQSARRGGWQPGVIDAFGDADTRACAHGTKRVAMDGEGMMSERDIVAGLAALMTPNADASLIYGAGIEAMPGLLERLGTNYHIVGNTPEVLRAVKDPITFFAALRALRIAHPQIRFVPPRKAAGATSGAQTHGWLVKRAAGTGGGHVRPWDGAPVSKPEHYFQRYLPGPPMSALFAADGSRARIIGYNTQWLADVAKHPFTYAGAVNRARLTPKQREIIAGYVGGLTCAFGLRGLNSLDFILYRGEPTVLEINPRPTATCELYEPETRDGMVALHVRACEGELPDRVATGQTKIRAHAIVYAKGAYQVPTGVQWPPWCRDLPAAGTAMAAGEPVCSVHAEGDDISRVSRMVDARRNSVLTSLNLPSIAA